MNQIVEATQDHCQAMAPRLRLNDLQEVRAMASLCPLDVLTRSVAMSMQAWTWLVNGQPAAMFGVVVPCLTDDKASPWLLTTDLVPKHRLSFWRGCRPFLARLRATYPHLEGWCDANYGQSVAWLERLGFKVEAPTDFGGIHLCRYTLENQNG